MGWGTELWDRLEAIESTTAEGINFISHVRSLAAKVAEVEKEYATKLAAVVSAAPPSAAAASPSFEGAWKAVLSGLEERSKQHDAAATALMADVCQPLKLLVKETTQKRQDHLKEVALQRAELDKHVATFDKRRKVYDKVEKEAEKAKIQLKKYEENPAQQKKVEPARRDFAKKAIGREEAERVLDQHLSELNRERIVHYHTTMPNLFDQMQAADEYRAMSVVNAMSQMLRTLEHASTTEARAIAAANETCQQFDKANDSAEVAKRYRSGAPQPDSLTIDQLSLNRDLHIAGERSPRAQRRIASVAEVAVPEKAASAAPPPPEPEAEAPPPPETNYQAAEMLYEFAGTNDGELPVAQGEFVYLMDDDGSGWALMINNNGQQGYVPAAYYRVV